MEIAKIVTILTIFAVGLSRKASWKTGKNTKEEWTRIMDTVCNCIWYTRCSMRWCEALNALTDYQNVLADREDTREDIAGA